VDGKGGVGTGREMTQALYADINNNKNKNLVLKPINTHNKL
jgi:hypothetical protein